VLLLQWCCAECETTSVDGQLFQCRARWCLEEKVLKTEIPNIARREGNLGKSACLSDDDDDDDDLLYQ
jgi:hypothetical protein